jgi:DNA adenine methylase
MTHSLVIDTGLLSSLPSVAGAAGVASSQLTGKPKSPFRYPGGKTKLLGFLRPAIDQILEGKDSFGDVYVGGGSALIDTAWRHPDIQLVANDLDVGIASFWKVVASEDYRALSGLIMEAEITVENFRRLRQLDLGRLCAVEAAFVRLVLNRTSFSGMGQRPLGGWSQTKNSIDSRWNPQELIRRIEQLHDLFADRLRVTNLHFRDFIKAHPRLPCYLDPPYLIAGPELYAHSMTSIEHRELAELCLDRTNWVLSLDDVPAVYDWYAGAHVYRIPAKYSINGFKQTHKRKRELLILDQMLASPLPNGMVRVSAAVTAAR